MEDIRKRLQMEPFKKYFDEKVFEEFVKLDKVLKTLQGNEKALKPNEVHGGIYDPHPDGYKISSSEIIMCLEYLSSKRYINYDKTAKIILAGLMFYNQGGFCRDYEKKIRQQLDEDRRWKLQEVFHENTGKLNKVQRYLVIPAFVMSFFAFIYSLYSLGFFRIFQQ